MCLPYAHISLFLNNSFIIMEIILQMILLDLQNSFLNICIWYYPMRSILVCGYVKIKMLNNVLKNFEN